MQVQDFALARKEVVFDVETVHGFEMAAQHGGRDQFGDGSGFAGRVFDGVQRFAASLADFALSCAYHCETRA